MGLQCIQFKFTLVQQNCERRKPVKQNGLPYVSLSMCVFQHCVSSRHFLRSTSMDSELLALLHLLQRPLLDLYQRQQLVKPYPALCMVHFSKVNACIPFDPALCMVHFSRVLACIPANPALCKIHF